MTIDEREAVRLLAPLREGFAEPAVSIERAIKDGRHKVRTRRLAGLTAAAAVVAVALVPMLDRQDQTRPAPVSQIPGSYEVIHRSGGDKVQKLTLLDTSPDAMGTAIDVTLWAPGETVQWGNRTWQQTGEWTRPVNGREAFWMSPPGAKDRAYLAWQRADEGWTIAQMHGPRASRERLKAIATDTRLIGWIK